MSALPKEIDLGVLSPSEATLADDNSYAMQMLRRQLEEELRAAEEYVKWELANMKIFIPNVTAEGLQHLEMYAEALARRVLCRNKLEAAFPRPGGKT